MTREYTVGQPRDEQEFQRLLRVLEPIFHVTPDRSPVFRQRVGDDNFRVVRCGDDIAGGLALVPMGQFFGGRSVSTTGIVTVGIAPHYRAKGAASALMAGSLRELHDNKSSAISTLYPATVPVYRRAGYEIAGSRFETSIALHHVDIRDTSLDVRPITDDDAATVRRLYTQSVQHHNGPLDRGDYMWTRVTQPRSDPAHGFIVHDGDDAVGYLYYLVKGDPMAAELLCTDLVALTPQAGRRLLTLLADHRSMEKKAVSYGGPSPTQLMLLREMPAEIRLNLNWMVRLVDVELALADRGYSQGLRAELHLDVSDDIIEANTSRYIVRIDDGRAAVERGGRGDLKLHVRALAALYTGHRTARDLITLGLAESASDAATASADAIFAGHEPWMVSIF